MHRTKRRAWGLALAMVGGLLLGGTPGWGQPAQTDAHDLYRLLREARTEAEQEALLRDAPPRALRELALRLAAESESAFLRKEYAFAMRQLQLSRLVAIRRNDKAELADIWRSIGILHFVEMRNAPGLDAYRESLRLNEELGRNAEMTGLLRSMGDIQARMGRTNDALAAYQRAAALHEARGEKNGVGQVLAGMGGMYYDQGDYAQAAAYFRQSLSWHEAAGAKNFVLSRVQQLAKLEYERGNDEDAIAFYERAATLTEAEGRSPGSMFHTIANIHYSNGEYARAMVEYRRALRAEEHAGERAAQAAALQGIGLTQSLLGNSAGALEAYEKELALLETDSDPRDYARSLGRVGGARYAMGQWDGALLLFKRAQALWSSLGERKELAGAWGDIGLAQAARNELAAAMEAYEQGRAIYESIGNWEGVAVALLNQSMIPFSRQEFAPSLALAERAIDAANRAKDRELYWQARYRAGAAQFRLADAAAARRSFLEAIATIEALRAPRDPAAKPRHTDNMTAPYLAMVDLAIAEERADEAFHYSERARLLLLNGMMRGGRLWVRRGMTAAEQAREGRLLADLRSLPAQLAREKQKPQPNERRVRELAERLARTQIESSAFRERLYRLHPRLKTLRAEGRAATLADASALVPNAKTVVLAYVAGEAEVVLYAFGRGAKGARTSSLQVYRLAANRAELGQRVSRFAQAVAERAADVDAQARELYDLLLKPAEAALAGGERLVLIPDADLWRLPFEALRGEEGRLLIERFAVTRVPSFTALASLAVGGGVAQGPLSPLLAVRRPAVSRAAVERLQALRGGSLSEDPDELRNLTAADGAMLEGGDATEDALKADGGKYRILHLATPMVYSEAAPFFSALALAGRQDDGALELRELAQLAWRARLVVFSRSEPASPAESGSRALTGLVWGLHLAGSPATLLRRWPVEGDAPERMFAAFHRALRAGRPPADAWRAAVLEALASESTRAPFFWAGYQLWGDPR